MFRSLRFQNEIALSQLQNRPSHLPAINRKVVDVNSTRGVGGCHTVDLKISQQSRTPTKCERIRYGDVDALLDVIEPDRLVSHITLTIV